VANSVAEHALAPLCALGERTPHADLIAGIAIRENPEVAMASVTLRQGRDADFAARAKKLFAIDLPGPGGLEQSATWSAFWTGPGQWMVTAPYATHEDIAQIVKAGVGDSASVTEQTDGWVRFEIEGARATDFFERICNVDIRRMQAGQATRCQIEHLGSFVLCRDTGTGFSLITLRSGAASMHHALVTAAKSLA